MVESYFGFNLLGQVNKRIAKIGFCYSKLSDDVQEALSSMIFAASRCGELPELHSLRNLFKQHFGQAFDRLNVELLPGKSIKWAGYAKFNRNIKMMDN